MSIPIEFSSYRPERTAPRAALRTAAEYRDGFRRGSLEVSDLSTTGAKISTLNPLTAGSRIWIKLPTLEAKEVEVIWAENFDAGCQFIEPLHPAVFQRLAATLNKLLL